MSGLAIGLLITGYFLIAIIGATLELAITNPNKKKISDVEDWPMDYGIFLLWPLALLALVIYGVCFMPAKGLNKLFNGFQWAVKEIKNPKENVKALP